MGKTIKSRKGLFAIYDCDKQSFSYSEPLSKKLGHNCMLWELVSDEDKISMEAVLENMSALSEPEFFYEHISLQDFTGKSEPYIAGFVNEPHQNRVIITFQSIDSVNRKGRYADDLLNREEFLRRLGEVLNSESPTGMVVYFDIQRFKMINSMFGTVEGDRLLDFIKSRLYDMLDNNIDFPCRLNADRFVYYTHVPEEIAVEQINQLFDDIAGFDLPFEIFCNAGIYVLKGATCMAVSALDRAIMAQKHIKGSYTQRYNFFTETLHHNLITEQEITGIMSMALKNGHFHVYYQPQYNHSTSSLVGAEALVRWVHPEKGMIFPDQFIPIFEKTGFISQIDMYVFETVCEFQQERLNNEKTVIPISVNLSRYDLFEPDFLNILDGIRKKYNVPSKYIRIELTETTAMGGSRLLNDALAILHSFGYTVEMDDFGTGYSSLNILKDTDFDVIKLDMRFFENEADKHSGRSSIILNSIVRMANMLHLSTVAEGVETIEQANYLRSIGCDYIQGYLYAKPMSKEEFKKLIIKDDIEETVHNGNLVTTMDLDKLLISDSKETQVLLNFVGGAAVLEYSNGTTTEILHVNREYLKEIGMNLSEKDVVNKDILLMMSESEQQVYKEMLDKAIETGEKQRCETWRSIRSECCGEEKICIRTAVQIIGKSKSSSLFYVMIRNITNQRKQLFDAQNNERRFKVASEQANIYYWEYTVSTREMRPCFRSMRDLGLPALLTDCPDSVIEMGIIPPETADMFRDWHRQIADGVPSLEAVIPLTVGRVPFHVRYTTEFDENGKPVKAYGSATLVVD